MTFVGLFPVSLARSLVFSFWVWGLLGLWIGLDLGVLDVIGLGLSSSGLSEDSEDPVEEPLICRERERPEARGRLLSLSLSLSMSRVRLDAFLLEAWRLNWIWESKNSAKFMIYAIAVDMVIIFESISGNCKQVLKSWKLELSQTNVRQSKWIK